MKPGRPGGNEGKGKDAGWQADGCPVYWFIRCFSHDVPRPAMKQAGDSLLVLESIMQRMLFSPIKTHPRARFTFNYDVQQRSYFVSTNFCLRNTFAYFASDVLRTSSIYYANEK